MFKTFDRNRCVSVILIMPLYAMAENQQYLFSGITAAIAIALVYSCGWRYGFRDARKIKGFSPDKGLPIKSLLIYDDLTAYIHCCLAHCSRFFVCPIIPITARRYGIFYKRLFY